MKVLIFSMTCGEGHNMISKSLVQAFNNKNIEAKIVQTFGYDEKRVALENKKFLWACKHIPHSYDFIWNKLRKKNHFTDKLPGYVKNCLPHFTKEINDFQPDTIICTHCYASSVITYMKKQNLLDKNILTSTVLFDFCLAPYWEHSNKVDFIFQPFENTTQDLIEKGYKKEQIITTGIPIRNDFYIPYEQDKIQEELKIPHKFTALIVAGGNGIGNTFKLLKSILKKKLDINIIVINGKNKITYNKIDSYLQKNKITNVINLGFVNNIDQYMKASDLIISRCGGCGISEILALGKPFIIREKLIINEKINKKMFIDLGCALGIDKISQIGNKVEYIVNNPLIFNSMKENIKKLQQKNSAEQIVDFLITKKMSK